MALHIVSWKFKPELTEAQREAARAELVPKLRALKDKIPFLTAIEVYCPPLPSSDCDLVLYSEVPEVAQLPLYQAHPDHQAVIPIIKRYFTARRCVDIEL